MKTQTPKPITDEGRTVRTIVEEYLSEAGFDGLWSKEDCACKLDDLMPCYWDCRDCQPGFLQPLDITRENGFRIGPIRRDAL